MAQISYYDKNAEGLAAAVQPGLPVHNPAHSPVMEEVNEHAFAGRLGGGQHFIAAPADGKSADAIRNPSWSSLLSLKPFWDIRLWKLALIEGVGSMLQTYLSGLLGHGLVPTASETAIGPVFPVAMASVAQIFLISIFIWCAGPITGAHFNPLITISTFLTKLSTLPRTVLYVFFQCIGAVVGGFLVRGALGAKPADLAIFPGCYVDPTLVTPGQAYILETTVAFAQIFLAFGLGLDPRNSSLGSGLSPLLIGISSAICIFFSGFARKGYLGAGKFLKPLKEQWLQNLPLLMRHLIATNPARCLGLMAAANRFDYHYIHWAGDITAAMINGLLYIAVPPYTARIQ